MDALFWLGQVGWLAFLACGAYVSFCFADLSDAESARTAKAEQPAPQEGMPSSPLPSFILTALD